VLHHVVHVLGIPAALLVRNDQVGVGAEVERSPTDEALPHRLLQECHVEGLDRGDVVGVLLDQVGEPMQHLRPLGDRERTPLVEPALRRGDGGSRSFVITAGDLGERAVVPGQRRTRLERLVRTDPGTTDQMIDRNGDATDVGPTAWCDHDSSPDSCSTVLW